MVVKSGEKCEWVIKYDHSGQQCCKDIGIISGVDKLEQVAWNSQQLCIVMFRANSKQIQARVDPQKSKSLSTLASNTPTLEKGQRVKLVLDTQEKSMSFYIDDAKEPFYTVDNVPELKQNDKNDKHDGGWRLFCYLDKLGL